MKLVGQILSILWRNFGLAFTAKAKQLSVISNHGLAVSKKKRKKDKILQYLRQSRHQSQHGRIAMNWTEGKLHIAPNFSGHVYSYAVFADGTNTIRAVPDHPSVGEAEIVLSPGDPTLPVIENKKYGQTYPPPTEFNGTEHTVKSPIQVATNGIKFYENVLQKALDKFQPSIKKGA
jgi:hypothetical protein